MPRLRLALSPLRARPMTWAIFAVVFLIVPAWVNNSPKQHPTGHFCRPQLMNAPLSFRKYTEGGKEGERDWCTGEVKRGRKWVASDELIEGSWCASSQVRDGDKCVPRPRDNPR